MKELVAKLEGLLRLRSIPFGMKLYESVAEMEAIPKIRRPKGSVHTLDQIVVENTVRCTSQSSALKKVRCRAQRWRASAGHWALHQCRAGWEWNQPTICSWLRRRSMRRWTAVQVSGVNWTFTELARE